MAEILLTHSYFLRLDPKQFKAMRPYPPLGTLWAAAVLKESGFQTAFHDVQLTTGPASLAAPLQDNAPKLLVIYDDGFNYLTKMCLTNMREAAFEMIRMGKQAGCKVIMSSSDATDHTQAYLEAGADFVIIGEGEQTLLELCNSLLRETRAPEQINGLAFLVGETLHRSARRENMRDLDQLPPPAWELVDFSSYREAWEKSAGYFSLNMGTTRGCPFKCNWCAKPIYGNRYNARSPEKVVEELLFLHQLAGFDHIWFSDDIFGLKPGWVKHFAALLREKQFRFRFKIQSRVDLLLEEANIQHLADAGCEEVWVGAESGSQTILDAMDKGTQVEQIGEATRLMKQHGIKPCFFLQFGYLGETKADIDKTLEMLFSLMPADIGISVSYPLPGTGFYEKVKSQLKDKTNWTDSDELLVMFRSEYAPGFYKKLQRYVHHEFRKRQGLEVWQQPVRLLKPADLRRALQTFYHAGRTRWEKQQLNQFLHEGDSRF